jgi:hypothetical protein
MSTISIGITSIGTSPRASRFRARQFITAPGVRRGTINVESLQKRSARIANLMLVAVLNQQQHTRCQRIASTFNPGNAGAVYHKQPLIRAAMTIPRTALCLSRLDDHFCRLAATISQGDPESFTEPKRFALHRVSCPAASFIEQLCVWLVSPFWRPASQGHAESRRSGGRWFAWTSLLKLLCERSSVLRPVASLNSCLYSRYGRSMAVNQQGWNSVDAEGSVGIVPQVLHQRVRAGREKC